MLASLIIGIAVAIIGLRLGTGLAGAAIGAARPLTTGWKGTESCLGTLLLLAVFSQILQTILNRVDLGMNISKAIAAPRASQRNTAAVTAEPKFIALHGKELKRYGHQFTPSGDAFTSAAEIGAATAIEFLPDGRMVAAAEPTRRGGGSAMVLTPSPKP